MRTAKALWRLECWYDMDSYITGNGTLRRVGLKDAVVQARLAFGRNGDTSAGAADRWAVALQKYLLA